MSDNNGWWGGLLGGLLGPSDEQLAELRRKYGIPEAEAPSAMVSMGRGAMDAWEPVKQMYLNHFHPDQANAYRVQRQEGERFYQRGLLSANPIPPGTPDWATTDIWRQLGRGAVAAPALLGVSTLPVTGPELLMSAALSGGAYSALDDVRRRLGIFTD